MKKEQDYRFDCGYCPNEVVVMAAGMKPAFEKWEANGFKCEECRNKETKVVPRPVDPAGAEWGETL